MTNYYRNVEEFFWNNWEDDDLKVNDDNVALLEHAITLMELNDEVRANQIIEQDDYLRSAFGPKQESILIIEEQSEPSDWESDIGSFNSETTNDFVQRDAQPRFRMNPNSEVKTELDDIPETSRDGATRNKRPRNVFNEAPKPNHGAFGIFTLNLDCNKDRKRDISVWLNEISLLIQTQPEAFDTPEKVILLAEHKSSGNLNRYLKNVSWRTQGITPVNTLNIIAQAVYLAFLGLDYVEDGKKEAKDIKNKAEERMTKMTLCDICYLESFYCDYEKSFYELQEVDETLKYVQLYLRKIPIVGEIARSRYEAESNSYTKQSLAYAHKLVKEEITKICNLSKTQKKLKKFNKSCCPKLVDDLTLDYGCKVKPKRKVFKYEKKRSSKHKRFQKRYVKKSFKPSKFARKPSRNPSKEKFCPKGKKNCRCWICSEEGHYANECPNKENNKKQFKMFQEVLSQGLVPIEEPYEHEHHVFEFFEEPPDSDGTTEYSSSESSGSDSE